MKSLFRRFIVPFILFLVSVALLLAGLWKVGHYSSQLTFPAEVETSSSGIIPLPEYTLMVELPKRIKLGTVEHLQLRLSPNTLDTNHDADIFSRFSLALESRLDLIGGVSTPQGLISAPAISGKTLVFVWNVHAESANDLTGTIWLYLSLMPLETGAGEELALYALPIEIPVTTILGLSTDVAIVLAGFGILISIVTSAFILSKHNDKKTVRKPAQKRK
jgi:hypothetical protein